jgi:hypothetical protein
MEGIFSRARPEAWISASATPLIGHSELDWTLGTLQMAAKLV